MSADVIAWIRSATFARWWSLPDRQLRIALTLVAMAEIRDGAMVAETTGDQLAARCGTSRGTILRAIKALTDAGFCVVSSKPGRRGTSVVTITFTDQSVEQEKHALDSGERVEPINIKRTVNNAQTDQTEVIGTVREYLADHGDRDQFPNEKPISLGQDASVSRARDQDLQGSSGDPDLRSDLRSSDPKILTTKVPDPGELPRDLRPKRVRTDPSKIPDRAWAAADYLRAQIIAEDGASFIAAATWTPGWSWTAGAGVQVGEGSRSGTRLSWANSFRLLHAWLLKAMRNVNPAATDDMAWEEIARTVHWLFHKQKHNGMRFVVQSPDSLRDKWDRIRRVIAGATGMVRQDRHPPALRPKYEDRGPPLSDFSKRRP